MFLFLYILHVQKKVNTSGYIVYEEVRLRILQSFQVNSQVCPFLHLKPVNINALQTLNMSNHHYCCLAS